MFPRIFFFLVFATSSLTIASCSGSSETGLFTSATNGTEPPPIGDGPNRLSGGSSSSSSGDASSGRASSTDGGSPGDALSNSDGSSSGKSDGGPVWKSPGIACGVETGGETTYCTGSEFCCATILENGGWSFACVSPSASACIDGRPLRCNDRSDCATGQVCCGIFQLGVGYRSSQCQPSCKVKPDAASAFVRFCDPNAPSDECASLGQKCLASESLDGYSYCQ